MRAFNAIVSQPWVILPERLQLMLRVASRDISEAEQQQLIARFAPIEPKAVAARLAQPLKGTETVGLRGNVAIVPIVGPIFRRADFFTRISGATDIDTLATDFTAAVDSPDVAAILLEIDSPGGEVNGVQEFADMIFAARSKKPVVSYVSGMAASGGYWIASAADSIIAAPTAMLGSIGVVMAWTDFSGAEQMEGIRTIEIVSTLSPKKRPDPETTEGRAQVLRVIDDLAEVFVGALARNRATTRAAVLEQFGGGDIMISGRAIAAGMADSLGSFEHTMEVIAERGRTGRRAAPSVPPHTTTSADGALTSEDSMPDTTATVEAPVITLDFLAEHHADLLAQIRTTAATAERERILGIQKITPKGHEALAATLVADPACTVEAASVKLLAALSTGESAYMRDVAAEGAETEDVAPGADGQFDSADRAIAFVMGAGRVAARAN